MAERKSGRAKFIGRNPDTGKSYFLWVPIGKLRNSPDDQPSFDDLPPVGAERATSSLDSLRAKLHKAGEKFDASGARTGSGVDD
ncbi:MAG TPA: hypothetical protein VL401_03440 [Alphaproteobacteria bacterium]|jgi:hypothetical protein|nr:hypothetical protein [Alphaproteobacteria bacterium]